MGCESHDIDTLYSIIAADYLQVSVGIARA